MFEVRAFSCSRNKKLKVLRTLREEFRNFSSLEQTSNMSCVFRISTKKNTKRHKNALIQFVAYCFRNSILNERETLPRTSSMYAGNLVDNTVATMARVILTIINAQTAGDINILIQGNDNLR